MDKQAAAACGQPLLMNAYRQVASEQDGRSRSNVCDGRRHGRKTALLNIKNTMSRLFESGIMPIINENDSVATHDLRVWIMTAFCKGGPR
jgi:glutamate 5-kinase